MRPSGNATRRDESKAPPVAGLVLAGGRGRRMGGRHKAFLELGGETLVARVARRLRRQVRHVAISANERQDELRAFGEVVLEDTIPGFAGPLAGVLAGLEWLRGAHPDIAWLLTVAVDTPFFPHDLARRLLLAAQKANAEVALAADERRRHPVFALWHVGLADDLRRALVQENVRKVALFLSWRRAVDVVFPSTKGGMEPFFNINTADDLRSAVEYAQNEIG